MATPPAPSKVSGALAGVLSGAVALGVADLVAGIGGGRRSPVIAVGDLVIDGVPRPVKDFAIRTFGTNDKTALLVGIYTLLAVVAAVVGIRATKRFSAGVTGIAVFGAIGVFAATQEVGVGIAELIASVLGAAAGIGALWLLLCSRHRSGAEPDRADAENRDGSVDRRVFLGLAAGAVVFAGVGRALQSRVSAASSRLAVVLPSPRRAAAAIPSGAELGLPGLSPYVTPNRSFYRIDVNLLVPQVAAHGWSMTVKGRVDREVSLTYDELLALPMEEHDITLACVSNEVGGSLVGNARWLGTPLLPILERAGIERSADQVVARSVDGFTVGFPVAALHDGRTALVAVGMNGEPLPVAHGFPARLVIAGLYGYVSATKWLKEIELTRFADYDTYWIERGWAVEAPIKTQSRIDTPRRRVAAGTVPVAGVAWAQTRGITRVELRVDDGEWHECELADTVGKDTWRQWLYRWDATPGEHRLTVRATDATGETQPEAQAEPFPDGATGWHSVTVTVTGGG
jgi:DMSO/TMAO reductase YedYZ molybdopterin-dependent catalytic subunit